MRRLEDLQKVLMRHLPLQNRCLITSLSKMSFRLCLYRSSKPATSHRQKVIFGLRRH